MNHHMMMPRSHFNDIAIMSSYLGVSPVLMVLLILSFQVLLLGGAFLYFRNR